MKTRIGARAGRAGKRMVVGLALACAAWGPCRGEVVPSQAGRAEAPDRSQRPGLGPVPALELPPLRRITLGNGLEILHLEKSDVPLVQVNVLVRAGSGDDPEDRLGLARFTADMLDEGAAGLGSLELADTLELLGARLSTAADHHFTTIGMRVPVARMEDALGLLAEIVTAPGFPADELERNRVARLTGLIRQHDEPQAIASALVARALFGETHVYGRPTTGTEASLRATSRDDLRAFHEAHYRPNNAAVIVVGAITAEEARRRIEAAFGRWPSAEVPTRTRPATGQVRGRVVYLVDMPGSAQSVVRIGQVGVARDVPDFYAIQVMNTILGGSFTSRLNQNLREDKGYTYGAWSGFDVRPAPGPFLAGADVHTDVTGPALAEFMTELRRIREPIPASEVRLARNFLAMRFPAEFQTVAGIAARLSEIVRFGLADDYFNDYTARILEVGETQAARAATAHVDPEDLVIVVVGDRARIEPQIRALDLGELRALRPVDVLGPVPVLSRSD